MLGRASIRFRSLRFALGCLLAVVAIAGQLAAASAGQGEGPGPESVLAADLVICHAGESGQPDRPARPAHGPDCAVCPLCAAIGHRVAVVATAPPIPPPRGTLLWHAGTRFWVAPVLPTRPASVQARAPPIPPPFG